MQSFENWCAKEGRKADRALWGGVGAALLGAMFAYLLAKLMHGAGSIAAPALYQFRWFAVLMLAMGSAMVIHGCWTHWQLYRDPVGLFQRRTKG
ncbi:hypothetical protein N800_06765 [Lysobacter daejeonensis GH1-9]|uniref:Transmembrane protein n=1 Tax=Lysobacter daejeonensis GH1-9 TaxID=1385517 RepID=A0A0A0EWL1_9GAMM|nr:hypothetical protein [Lysobacter daejeonensis]KGM54675.1 hypothetical protein N800_06765 [Lysobacter daejeonensis GH1-9]